MKNERTAAVIAGLLCLAAVAHADSGIGFGAGQSMDPHDALSAARASQAPDAPRIIMAGYVAGHDPSAGKLNAIRMQAAPIVPESRRLRAPAIGPRLRRFLAREGSLWRALAGDPDLYSQESVETRAALKRYRDHIDAHPGLIELVRQVQNARTRTVGDASPFWRPLSALPAQIDAEDAHGYAKLELVSCAKMSNTDVLPVYQSVSGVTPAAAHSAYDEAGRLIGYELRYRFAAGTDYEVALIYSSDAEPAGVVCTRAR